MPKFCIKFIFNYFILTLVLVETDIQKRANNTYLSVEEWCLLIRPYQALKETSAPELRSCIVTNKHFLNVSYVINQSFFIVVSFLVIFKMYFLLYLGVFNK